MIDRLLIRRNLIISLVLVVMGVGIWQLIRFSHHRTYSATLTIKVAPADSTLTLNGDPAKAGVLHLQPGEYVIAAKRDGFGPASKTLTLTASQLATAGIVLVPNSDATADWYYNHPKDEQIAESISSQTNDQRAQASVANVPLIQNLPYIGPGNSFRVDYTFPVGGDPTKPTIVIESNSPNNRDTAINWIKGQGFDPAKLTITYAAYPGGN